MPRLGSSKNNRPPPNPGPAAITSTLDPNAYEPVSEEVRQSQIQAADATLHRIRQIKATTRDRKGRIRRAKFLAAVLALRFEGFMPKETAEILGVTQAQVDHALARMRQDAEIDAQLDRLDKIVIPLAVDNVMRGVMNGDKEYTLKVLDGRGVFRTHKSLDAQVKKTVLTMKIETVMPTHLKDGEIPIPKPGAIVGVPKLPVLESDDTQQRPARRQLPSVSAPETL